MHEGNGGTRGNTESPLTSISRGLLEIPVIAVKSREAAREVGDEVLVHLIVDGTRVKKRAVAEGGKRGDTAERGRRRGQKGESGKPNNRPASTSVSVRSRRKRGDEMDRPTDRNLHPLVRNLRE